MVISIQKQRNMFEFFYWIIISWALWIKFLFPLPIKKADVTNVLVIIFIGIYLLKFYRSISLKSLLPLFCFVFISITSSLAASVYFGQSFIDGFLVLRHMYIQYAICLPLFGLLDRGIISKERIYNMTISAIRFACVLYVCHYIIYESTGFSLLNIDASSHSRYGSARFYFNLIMPVFLLMHAVSVIYQNKITKKAVFDIVLVAFLIIQVGKMRMTALASVCGVIAGFVVVKNMGLKKIVYLLLGIGVAVLFLFFTPMGQDLLDILFGKTTPESNSIRAIGRLRHLYSFLKHPLFGLGYPHENCSASMAEFGTSLSLVLNGTVQKIYIGDNGIFDFLYIFGISGVLWLVLVFWKLLHSSFTLLRTKKNCTFFMFLVFIIVSMYTELNWFFGGMLFFGILTFLLAPEYNNLCVDNRETRHLRND